ncbi:hypothetical protein BH23ACT10_BH23ACT10_13310 [soil metagenome]
MTTLDLEAFNTLDRDEAVQALRTCCASQDSLRDGNIAWLVAT